MLDFKGKDMHTDRQTDTLTEVAAAESLADKLFTVPVPVPALC